MKTVSQGHFVQGNLIFAGSGESYLIGRVHGDAQGAAKTGYYVRKPDSHPLWRSVSAASFSDPHWTQECDCNRDTFYPTEQSLHRRGIAACHPLPNHSWSRTNRDNTVVATQWCLSVPERTADLPRPQHPQTFLASHGTPGSNKAAQTPRPVLGQDDRQTLFAISLDLRPRFHRPCGLRKTTGRISRLQSHQAWTTLVSSTALLRGTNQRLLAWGAAPRKCSYCQRYPGFAQSLLCQNPFGNQICDNPRRQRILRPQDRRVVGRVQSSLCHRRQAHPTYQTQVGSSEIRLGEYRSANSRILLSAHSLVSPLPLRSYSTTSAEESDQQLTLFKLGSYHYQVLVTNLDLRPLNVWRFYNGRAGIERIIRDLKGDYPLGKIPTRHFFANDTYFHLLLLAYNLVNWFKRLCLPREFQTATLDTLRNRILLMPAQLLRTGNRPRLAMPAGGPRENAWKHALNKIEKLRL